MNYQDLSGLSRPAKVERDADGRYVHTFESNGPVSMPDHITVTPEIAEIVGRKVLIDKVVSDLQYVRGPFESADELRDKVVAALKGGGFREVTE